MTWASLILRIVAFAVFLLLVVIALTACAQMTPAPPEPVIVTKEVQRIIQVRCEDKRQPVPDFPDDDADLAAIPAEDIFGLAQIYRAARTLYRQRLRDDDAQIAACSGE